jgi:hypothetical protein
MRRSLILTALATLGAIGVAALATATLAVIDASRDTDSASPGSSPEEVTVTDGERRSPEGADADAEQVLERLGELAAEADVPAEVRALVHAVAELLQDDVGSRTSATSDPESGGP